MPAGGWRVFLQPGQMRMKKKKVRASSTAPCGFCFLKVRANLEELAIKKKKKPCWLDFNGFSTSCSCFLQVVEVGKRQGKTVAMIYAISLKVRAGEKEGEFGFIEIPSSHKE